MVEDKFGGSGDDAIVTETDLPSLDIYYNIKSSADLSSDISFSITVLSRLFIIFQKSFTSFNFSLNNILLIHTETMKSFKKCVPYILTIFFATTAQACGDRIFF
jgi:hypothetical protein